MKRIEAIKIISRHIKEKDMVFSTTGMISREFCDIKDRNGNFYLLGSMGLTSSVGLGAALCSRRKVFILEGDGSALMDMGTIATIGVQKPKNLTHIVLDNESYDSTGGQPTLSGKVKFEKIAIACEYKHAARVTTKEQLEKSLNSFLKKNGPNFILVKITGKSSKSVQRVKLTPAELSKRFALFGQRS